MTDKKRIMLVDDQFVSRLLLQEALKQEYEIGSFSSPQKAIRALKEERPDLVITDLMMPGMDGFDFTHQAKQLYRDLPVLAVSAYTDYHQHDMSTTYAFDDFLAKPFRIASLQKKVKRMIRPHTCLNY